MIRVVLADDHPVVLAGLRDLLDSSGEFTVVESCRDGLAALRATRANRPDVLIVDLRMPVLDGLEVVRTLQDDEARPRIVLLTAVLDESDVSRARRLGVDAVVLKEAALEQLVECVRTVHAGQPWGEPAEEEPEVLAGLTAEERRLALLLVRGVPPERLPESLNMSSAAVEALLAGFGQRFGIEGLDTLRRFFATALRSSSGTGGARRRSPDELLQDRFGFTPREAAVALLLTEGLPNREISERLGITLNTVKTHVSNIHAKAGVSSTRKLLVLLREIPNLR